MTGKRDFPDPTKETPRANAPYPLPESYAGHNGPSRRASGGWRSALGILVALIAMAALISSLALSTPPPPVDPTDRDNAGGGGTDGQERQSQPEPSGWRLVDLA